MKSTKTTINQHEQVRCPTISVCYYLAVDGALNGLYSYLSIITIGRMETLCSRDGILVRIGESSSGGRSMLNKLMGLSPNTSGMMNSFCVISLHRQQRKTPLLSKLNRQIIFKMLLSELDWIRWAKGKNGFLIDMFMELKRSLACQQQRNLRIFFMPEKSPPC